jgi:hypothetical protein
MAFARDRQVFLLSVDDLKAPARRVGRHGDPVRGISFGSSDGRLVSWGGQREIRVWSLHEGSSALQRTIRSGLTRPRVALDYSLSKVVAGQGGAHETPDVAFV